MKARWQDWINLALGVWLFFSPWLLYYTGVGLAAWQAYFLGGAIFLFSLWALFDEKEWGQRLNGVLGLWLVVSPWVLSFDQNLTATINTLIVGGVAAIIAGSSLRRPRPPRESFGTYSSQGHR